MNISVGSQQAHTINYVEGTQNNAYGVDPRDLVEELRAELARAHLAPEVQAAASAKVDEVAAEVARPEPSKPAIAERLGQLTTILTSAGALVAAGTGLGGPLVALAGWLGPLGESIGRLLRRG